MLGGSMKKNKTFSSEKLDEMLEEERQEMLAYIREKSLRYGIVLSDQDIENIEEYSWCIPQRVCEFLEKQQLK
jgi:hypothetical protein